MRAALLVSLLLSPLLLTPAAAAGGACSGDHVTVDARAAGGRLFYVGTDGRVWEETNGLAGLQCTAVLLGGRVFAADTAVLV